MENGANDCEAMICGGISEKGAQNGEDSTESDLKKELGASARESVDESSKTSSMMASGKEKYGVDGPTSNTS